LLIRDSLKKERPYATTIIVSHRLTTLASADRVLVLEDGRIADSGTHEELVSRPGLYRRIWEIQAGLETELEALENSQGQGSRELGCDTPIKA
jgi:ATP-binding cassette subfamily B protein